MLSQNAIQTILGIKEHASLSVQEMATKLNITFYPNFEKASKSVRFFSKKLEESLKYYNVNIVPFEDSWYEISFSRRIKRFLKYNINNIIWILRRCFFLSEVSFFIPYKSIIKLSGKKRIKKGVSVICIGEQSVDDLPMQYISNFKDNSIIEIVDFPKNINKDSSFSKHFDAAMSLFAYHMANIVISVDETRWMVYNFNASHPIYDINDGKFNEHILNTFIPKIVAPISPHRLSEFRISNNRFDIKDDIHKSIVNDMEIGAKIFDKTNLYPAGKKIDELPFRHNFHRLVGKLHLDNRSGMSFGYLAFQMPTKLAEVVTIDEFYKKLLRKNCFDSSDYFVDQKSKEIFILLELFNKKVVCKVPDVWVMTLRSGSDKTHFNPETDLIKLGLVNGEMWMEFPKEFKINLDYKPSFDTKVILAHAVGNAIIASVLNFINSSNKFADKIANKGFSISHWHGYFNKNMLPKGMYIYGLDNPHVSCSSPQSAIYALDGKIKNFLNLPIQDKTFTYNGDIHVEPHHGINVCYNTLQGLAEYILNNPNSTEIGNRYL